MIIPPLDPALIEWWGALSELMDYWAAVTGENRADLYEKMEGLDGFWYVPYAILFPIDTTLDWKAK